MYYIQPRTRRPGKSRLRRRALLSLSCLPSLPLSQRALSLFLFCRKVQWAGDQSLGSCPTLLTISHVWPWLCFLISSANEWEFGSFFLNLEVSLCFCFFFETLDLCSYLFYLEPKHCKESSSNSTILLFSDFILQLGHTVYCPSYWVFGDKGGTKRYQWFVEFLLEGRETITGLWLLPAFGGGLCLGERKSSQFPGASLWCMRRRFWNPQPSSATQNVIVSTSFLTLKLYILIISYDYCFIGSMLVLLFFNSKISLYYKSYC